MFSIERRNSISWDLINRTLLILDLDGNIYFQRQLNKTGGLAEFSAEFINSTTILYGDSNGANLWNLERNITVELNISGRSRLSVRR